MPSGAPTPTSRTGLLGVYYKPNEAADHGFPNGPVVYYTMLPIRRKDSEPIVASCYMAGSEIKRTRQNTVKAPLPRYINVRETIHAP